MVVPTRLPLILRRCPACPGERFRASGKFRVNAHHKLLDAWLLARCVRCDETAKLSVLERVNVRLIRPDLLDRLHTNDPDLTTELLADPSVLRRNRIALDWTGAWRLDTGDPAGADSPGCSAENGHEVSVRFAARIPVRPGRLIATGLGISRAEVERLIAAGNLVSTTRLAGLISTDFEFLLKH